MLEKIPENAMESQKQTNKQCILGLINPEFSFEVQMIRLNFTGVRHIIKSPNFH